MIQQDLATFVLADSGVNAQIGDRFFPMLLPEGTALPAAVYQVVSVARDTTVSGSDQLASMRIQIDCFGATYAVAAVAKEAFRTLLHGFSGAMGTTTVQLVELVNEINFLEDAPRLFRISQDFLFWFTEI